MTTPKMKTGDPVCHRSGWRGTIVAIRITVERRTDPCDCSYWVEEAVERARVRKQDGTSSVVLTDYLAFDPY